MTTLHFRVVHLLLINIMAFFLVQVSLHGQTGPIAQFAVWQPKEGQAINFENGYKQHLLWHKANKDTWNWYGWYIISGPRFGQFVDASLHHAWRDFDNPVKPSADMEDNRKNVFPFANLQAHFKISLIRGQSIMDTTVKCSKLVRMVTLSVSDIDSGLKIADSVLKFFVKEGIKSFQTFRMADGGPLEQIFLFLGFNSWEEFSMSERIGQIISDAEQGLQIKTIKAVVAETLAFREDMSLFPNQPSSSLSLREADFEPESGRKTRESARRPHGY